MFLTLFVTATLFIDDGDAVKPKTGPIQPTVITHGSAEVSIVQVSLSQPPIQFAPQVPRAKPTLRITVRIKNLSRDRPLHYIGWATKEGPRTVYEASAQADTGRLLLRPTRSTTRGSSDGPVHPVTIAPRAQLEDTLPFDAPPDDCNSVGLFLPCDSLELDESFSFTIERAAWTTPKAERKSDPKDAAGGQEVTGIELVSTGGVGGQAVVRLSPGRRLTFVRAGQKVGGWTIISIDPQHERMVVATPKGERKTIKRTR